MRFKEVRFFFDAESFAEILPLLTLLKISDTFKMYNMPSDMVGMEVFYPLLGWRWLSAGLENPIK